MRMLLILALVCAPMLYAQADPVRGPAPKPGQADFKDGEDAFNEGRMQEAVDAFTKSLDAAPKNHEALAYRAAAYVALGKLESAEEDVDAAIKLESDFSLTWNTRGYIRWLQKNFPGAIEDFTSAIAYGTDDRRIDDGGRAQMHQNRGIAWQDAGNTDRALLDFNRCIELQPDNPAFFENRGLIFVDKRMFDVAFKDFDRALELDSKNARAYVNRAWTARLMGDYEQSVRDYSQALRLKEDYAQALIGRGYTWLAWARPELAKKDFEAASKIEGHAAGGRVGLGDINLERGEYLAAEKQFMQAMLHDTYSEAAWYGLARAQFMLKKNGEAGTTARTLCGMAPRRADYWRLYADILAAQSNWQGVIVALNRILELVPGHIETLQQRLRCYAKLGMFELAKGDASQIGESETATGAIADARVAVLEAASGWKKFALAYLGSARSLGADLKVLADDPDFAALKDDPAFQQLTGE